MISDDDMDSFSDLDRVEVLPVEDLDVIREVDENYDMKAADRQ